MNAEKKTLIYFNSDRLADIYDTFHRPIYCHVFCQVSDMETARDLTADVFHRLIVAVQKGNPPNENIRAWLYRTAHNIVIDHYRRQQFRAHEPLLPNFAADTPDPAQTAETHITILIVRSAFTRLTLDQRQVISLRFLEGLSCAETAVIMHKSTGAIKSLQHRALKALQREIQRQEEQPQAYISANGTSAASIKKGMDPHEPIPAVS